MLLKIKSQQTAAAWTGQATEAEIPSADPQKHPPEVGLMGVKVLSFTNAKQQKSL